VRYRAALRPADAEYTTRTLLLNPLRKIGVTNRPAVNRAIVI